MRIVAFSNQKGGVAKTTSSYALAVGLANRGYKVLVVDADPQENLSMTARIDLNEIDPDPEDIDALTPEQQEYFFKNVPAKLFEVMKGEKDINPPPVLVKRVKENVQSGDKGNANEDGDEI